MDSLDSKLFVFFILKQKLVFRFGFNLFSFWSIYSTFGYLMTRIRRRFCACSLRNGSWTYPSYSSLWPAAPRILFFIPNWNKSWGKVCLRYSSCKLLAKRALHPTKTRGISWFEKWLIYFTARRGRYTLTTLCKLSLWQCLFVQSRF